MEYCLKCGARMTEDEEDWGALKCPSCGHAQDKPGTDLEGSEDDFEDLGSHGDDFTKITGGN